MAFQAVSVLLGGSVVTKKPAWLPGYPEQVNVLVPAAGADVKVFARDADQSTATPLAVYPNEDGTGTPLTQPLVADADGLVPGYTQQPGALDIALSGAGLTPRTVKAGLQIDSSVPTSVLQVLSGSAVGLALEEIASPTYGPALVIGNYPSFGFGGGGTGTPADAFAPLVVAQQWNAAGSGFVEHTTQTAFMYGLYRAPTLDDSPEVFSASLIFPDTGTPFHQTVGKGTAIEGNVLAEGGNIIDFALAVGGRISALNTSTIAHATAVYAGGFVKDAGASFGQCFAFEQAGPGQGATNYGMYLLDLGVSETGFAVGKSSSLDNSMLFQAKQSGVGGSSNAFVYIRNPQIQGSIPDMASLRIDAISGQNQPMIECFTFGASAPTMTVAKDGTITTIAGVLVKSSGGATRGGIDNFGNVLVQANAITTAGGMNNSQTLLLQASYDRTGSASASGQNFKFRHTMLTAGSSPTSKLSLLRDDLHSDGAEVWSVDQLGNVTALGAIKPGRYATGGRPSASSVGVGGAVYDSTLSKPIWSDGTTWRDSTGAIV